MKEKKILYPLKYKIAIPFGSLGLSILLWFFVVSGKDYNLVLDLPIEARNLSAQMAHKEEVPSYASIKIRGTGRDLFKTILLKDFSGFKLVLDLEGISKEYEFDLNSYFDKYPRKVVLPLNFNLTFIEVVYPSRIKISLDENQIKQVPVVSNIHIVPKPGYLVVGDILMQPEQIQIAGPKEEIAFINHVETVFDTINEISMPFTSLIKINNNVKLIKYLPEKIQYKINVQQISERIIANIIVNINNVPEKIRVFPSPQTVSLTVIGGLDRISGLDPEEIKVFVDFDNWNNQIQFYEPRVELPKDILSWKDLSPKSLEIAVAREIQ